MKVGEEVISFLVIICEYSVVEGCVSKKLRETQTTLNQLL